jgi:hypothetical protein
VVQVRCAEADYADAEQFRRTLAILRVNDAVGAVGTFRLHLSLCAIGVGVEGVPTRLASGQLSVTATTLLMLVRDVRSPLLL